MGAAASYLQKQAFVEELYDASVASGDSFLATIKAARKAAFEISSSGRVLTSSAANGHSHVFELLKAFSPIDALNLMQEIRNRYTEANEYLVEEEDIESPTDAQIYAEMIDKIHPVKDVLNDYYGARVEPEEVTS